MKRLGKALSLSLVAALLLLTFLAGCGGKDQAGTDAGKGNDGSNNSDVVFGETPLEFTFYGHYDWYTMPQWGDDAATKWIKENKKVNVKPIHSGGNAQQKLSTMIVSKEMPDVIWLDRGSDVEKLRAAGMLEPLDDYIDKYPNVKEWVGESTLNMLRSPDGHIYQIPNWYTSQPNGNSGYIVNKKIYNELGAPKLETTEDLYNYLKLVKEKYPNVVPFESDQAVDGQALDVLYGAFGEDHPPAFVGEMAVPNGKEMTSIFTDSVFRESMQYASKLFREKLMTQDAMTQTKDQVKEKVYTGRIAVLASSSPTEYGSFGDTELKKSDPDAGYIMIWPVHKSGLDKNKIWTGTFSQLGWNVSVITKAAKNPEAIFAFLDWYTGPEGQRNIFWGPEGLYWDGVDETGAPIFTDAYVNDVEGRSKLMDTTNNFLWNGNTVYIDTSKMKFESTLPEEKQNWESRWQSQITWKTQYNATEFVNLDPLPDTEEGIIAQQVGDIFKEARAKALYAKNDAEVLSIFDKAEKDAQGQGYDKLLKFKAEKWQENVARMQGK